MARHQDVVEAANTGPRAFRQYRIAVELGYHVPSLGYHVPSFETRRPRFISTWCTQLTI
jgi:hypothetical protein